LLAQYLQRLTSYGVGWRSFTESILATIAAQERIRISERVTAGLARARRHGRIGGRPRIIANRQRIADMRAAGKTRAEIAAQFGMSTRTVSRLWNIGNRRISVVLRM
jgi:DNA invertase Pin-like site-specific DNA recombinase